MSQLVPSTQVASPSGDAATAPKPSHAADGLAALMVALEGAAAVSRRDTPTASTAAATSARAARPLSTCCIQLLSRLHARRADVFERLGRARAPFSTHLPAIGGRMRLRRAGRRNSVAARHGPLGAWPGPGPGPRRAPARAAD